MIFREFSVLSTWLDGELISDRQKRISGGSLKL